MISPCFYKKANLERLEFQILIIFYNHSSTIIIIIIITMIFFINNTKILFNFKNVYIIYRNI